ncbi:MAG: SPASM domain-containing protein [Bacilli bacterium]
MNNDYKFIHLLYVPTMNCNMQCKYCYLKENTVDLKQDDQYLKTLDYAVKKLKKANIIPFNISLHGGEVTTLSKEDFRSIIEFIKNYYRDNKKIIEENGFKLGAPHIKTNLLNLKKHIETIREFNVSISGSLDLPFSLHEEYRVTKGNQKTLDKILDNVELLGNIPNKKKVSATIFKEHYNKIDEIIKDIKYLEKNTCLDMNDFNFMIGFTTSDQDILTAMSEEEQVNFYKKMKKEFAGTSLEVGVKNTWFAEFNPTYCTNCTNCGEKYFLLERNGDIYSCVRGQKNKDFFYGNIYNDTVDDIMNNARNKMFENHNFGGFNDECLNCKYLYLCKTGCPYVKKAYNTNKSYTCKLQQEIYKDNETLYPQDVYNDESIYLYMTKMHPERAMQYYPNNRANIENSIPLLKQIIYNDKKLENIYSSDVFVLKVDDDEYNLESQVTKIKRDIIYLTKQSNVKLYIKKEVLEMCDYPVNNSLYMILLSGNTVEYGDEKRTKQEHIMSHQIYTNTIKKTKSDKQKYYCIDITKMLSLYYDDLSPVLPNNLLFTTSELRDYHYTKQKNNAYYHIQAINLPFQNIEFLYINCEEEKQ